MARKYKVDMTGVEDYVRCEEGVHIAKVKSIEEGTSSAGNDTLSVKFQVIKGSSTGAVVYDTITLVDKAKWRLKQFLVALGMKADGKIVLDLDALEGKTCQISVFHEVYEGKQKSKVSEYLKLPVTDDDDDFEDEEEDEEEAPKPVKKAAKPAPKKEEPVKKAKKKPEPEPEEDDEDDDWEDDEE